MRHPRPHSTSPHARRIERLAAAIDAHRDGNPRRHVPRALRAQVLAAIEAGAPVSAVCEACQLSASQITRWRQAADSSSDGATASTAELASPRILSVIDADPLEDARLDGEIELRIGGWHVSLRRVVQ